MKTPAVRPTLFLCIAAGILLPGCSLFGLRTETEVKKAQATAYEKGLANGRAAEVRARFHQEQREKELPLPPPPKRYYRVPIQGYTTQDGIRIENHEVTLEVVQP